MRFLVDESLPDSLAQALRNLGHEAEHVSDIRLRSGPDELIFGAAQRREAIVITRDVDFADEVRFPLGTHGGLVILRFPTRVRFRRVVSETLDSLSMLSEEDIKGNIVIIEPHRTRIRRKSTA